MKQLIIYADGGSKSSTDNVCGVSIQDVTGKELAYISQHVGNGTNNTSEYMSAILGLEKAKSMGASQVQLVMDSQLVIRQLEGIYSVTKAHLKPLHERALKLLKSFDTYYLTHVPRELNKRADELANLAYKV